MTYFWCEKHKCAHAKGDDTADCLLVGPFPSKADAESWPARSDAPNEESDEQLFAEARDHMEKYSVAASLSRELWDATVRIALRSATGEPVIGEVIGHKEMGLALVQWSDNGLRPIGTKVSSLSHAGTQQPSSDALSAAIERERLVNMRADQAEEARDAAVSATPATEGERLLILFGAWAMDEHREEVGDLDGGSIQDHLEKLGMLESVLVTEPCGEYCKCAEYDDFPQDCLRATAAVREALSKARKVLLAPSDSRTKP